MTDFAATNGGVEEILSAVPIFSRLGKRDLKKLAKLCVPKTFAEGETLIEEGATGLGLFVITSGRAEVFKGSGADRTVLGAMETGDVLGEIALVDNQPRSASAVAQTTTECLLLTRDSFETLVKNDPEIAWCIVPSLAERVRELHARALASEEKLRQSSQEDRSEATAAAKPKKAKAGTAPEAEHEAESEDEDEDDNSEAWESMASMMRMPYAMAVGGLTGVAAMAKMGETFFRKLADETDLRDSDDLSEIMNKAPDGFVAATREALSDMEKMPQDMVDSFRSIYKEE